MPTAAVSDKTFGREVLGAAIPVLVEFTAEHVPSTEVLGEVSGELAGTVKVVRVDVGRHPSLKDEYSVRGLPTLILFKYGKPVARRVGSLATTAEVEEWIDGALILALATRRTSATPSATDFKMANGMGVVVIPDHRAPIVTHMVWYKVGSADEPKHFSGIARLLQEVTFKSLDKIANGDFANTVLRLGGDTDGFSYRDATVFWQRVPREHLMMVMELEVDRMINLRLTEDDVTSERGAILEQRRSAMANHPGARLAEEMNAALFRAHPYGLPVDGLPNEVARLSRDDLLRFHRQHYGPNNAILVVSGDVTPEEVKLLASETYARIPANPNVWQRPRTKAPPQIVGRRVALEDPGSETQRFYRTYAVPGYATAAGGEAETLDVLTNILVGGTESRLYRKLVIEDKVATSVWGSYRWNMDEAGELALVALTTGADLSEVEASIDDVLDDIRNNGVAQEELVDAKRFLVANHIYDGAEQLRLSYRYGWAAVLGLTIKDVEERAAAISRVTAEDVAKVAMKYVIARRSVTGWLSSRRKGKTARRTRTPSIERRLL